jgi:uncharacterized protein (DUF305 family)
VDLLTQHSLKLRALVLSTVLAIGSGSIASAHDAAHHAHGADAAAGPDLAQEAPFLAENQAAMTKMMNEMAVAPTGDVDRDFVAMMVPHHQGAIDMALAVLRHGRNEQLRRLAQEIIVTQQQEIAAMRLAVGEPLPESAAAPTQPAPASGPQPTSEPHGAMSMSNMK